MLVVREYGQLQSWIFGLIGDRQGLLASISSPFTAATLSNSRGSTETELMRTAIRFLVVSETSCSGVRSDDAPNLFSVDTISRT